MVNPNMKKKIEISQILKQFENFNLLSELDTCVVRVNGCCTGERKHSVMSVAMSHCLIAKQLCCFMGNIPIDYVVLING